MEKVNFDYDQKSNILFISYDSGFILSNAEDIQNLFVAVQERIAEIGHRVALISNLTNFRMKLDREILEYGSNK